MVTSDYGLIADDLPWTPGKVTSVLSPPYRLDFDTVVSNVWPLQIGAFALGYFVRPNVFVTTYVGRADQCLRTTILGFVGTEQLFRYELCSDEAAAFVRECEMFHDLFPSGNRVHPSRSKPGFVACPRCIVHGPSIPLPKKGG